MKQQESNQFDKGMSLDTNPIAMDNHTLSGALNATMITMNGNELVLQNDMGNARVETAYLPEGFVPVGTKEYGGIVYVASYNPINGQSQIGSFPSPERNISNQDAGHDAITFTKLTGVVGGDGSQEVTTTYERSAILIGDSTLEEKYRDILRPGDQLAVYGTRDANLVTYSDLSIIIVDSDNNSIDITDNIIPNGLPATVPTKIPYYKGKISGKAYVVETLKLPSYLTVAVGGDKTGNGLKVTITPSVDDPNFITGVSYNYYFKYSGVTSGTSTGSSLEIDSLPSEGILTYTVMLQMPYGKIKSMARSGQIDLAKVGTGQVDFNYFFYYNDIKKEQIQFDYDIMAYLKDNQEIKECYLALKEIVIPEGENSNNQTSTISVNINTSSIQNNSSDMTHKIELSVDDTSGSFSTIIPYGSGQDGTPASTLAMGKIYVGRICVTTSLETAGTVTEETKMSNSPFCIITSSITNEYYMMNSTGNSVNSENFMRMMYAPSEDPTTLYLDSEVDWSHNVQETINKEVPISGMTDTNIISQNDSEYSTKKVIKYGVEQQTVTTVSITPKVRVIYPDESFPVKEKITVNTTIDQTTDETPKDDITYTNDLTWTSSSNSVRDDESLSGVTFETSQPEPMVIDDNTMVTKQSSTSEANTGRLVVTLMNKLPTKYYGLLGEAEEYNNNDTQAVVSYMSEYENYKIEQLLATGVFYDGTESVSTMRPESWFSFETYESGKNNRNRTVAIMRCEVFYSSCTEAGGFTDQGETNEHGGITLFTTTSANANWNFYSKTITDYYHSNLNVYPSILFLSGCSSGNSSIYQGGKPGNRTMDYAIPILFSTSGDLYMLNEWDNVTASSHPLYKVVQALSRIYILQDHQSVTMLYKKSEEYMYMLPYSVNVSIPVKATIGITFPNYDSTYISVVNRDDNETVTYQLPKFDLANKTSSYDADYSLSNPDVYSEIETYINGEFEISSCAIIPNPNGADGGSVITHSVDNNGNKQPIDPSHFYYYNGTNLIDCYENEISYNPSVNLGSGIANALYKKNQYLTIRKDTNTDYNTIYINKSYIAKILKNDCNRWIGVGGDKETKMSDIAPRHIIRGLFGLAKNLNANT